MAELAVEREYTVFEDDQGREFFKQPQPDGSLKKVYLGDQPEEQPVQEEVLLIQDGREPFPRQDNVIIVEDSPPSQRGGTETVLLIPSSSQNSQRRSPPPSRSKNEDQNLQVIVVDNKPKTPQQQEPETIYITREPEPHPKQGSPPTVIVVQEPEPRQRRSPEVVYIQNDPPPEPVKQPSQTVIMIDEQDPSQGGYYTPSPRGYHGQNRQPYRSTPRSQAGPVSPWPKPQRKEKPAPKYQLQPRPDQPTALVGGMLVIDNEPWQPQSKVNHRNPNYHRSGGDILIPQDKLKWKAKQRIDDKNVGYVRGGGNVPILHENLAWDGKPRVDDWNPEYQRGGGNVIIVHENLKWRKNPKRKARSQPVPLTSRSLDSSVRDSVSRLDESLSSNDDSKVTHRDYPQNRKTVQAGGYAGQFKGKIHRYKATDGSTPYFDLQKRKPMLKTDDDLVVIDEAKQPPPEKATMNRQKQPKQSKPNVPWFKQQSEKHEDNSRPRQYYPNKSKPLPPIASPNHHVSAPTPRKKYVLPQDKSLPWQKKGDKLEKVNAKKLDTVGKSRKKIPGIVPYNSDNYHPRYDNGYEDYDDYGNQYSQVQQDGGYRNNYQDREHLRENNKYTNNHKHHHFPTRKRNEPVY